MDPLFYPRQWAQQEGKMMSTFLRRLLDEGMQRYLASFDDEPVDAADDYAGSATGMFLCGTGMDEVLGTPNDADDERTAQLLHDAVEDYIPCPRCGDRLDDLAERSERLCRPCMLELMDITPEELDRYLAEKYPDPDRTLTVDTDWRAEFKRKWARGGEG